VSDFLQYEIIEPDIHYYIWQESTLDTFITYIQHSRQQVLTDEIQLTSLKILLDFSVATLPDLDELVSFTVDQRRYSPEFHNNTKRIIAYLSDERDLPAKIDYLATLATTKNQREYFRTNKKDDAITWLLEQEI